MRPNQLVAVPNLAAGLPAIDGARRGQNAGARHSGPLLEWSALNLDWSPISEAATSRSVEKRLIDGIRALEHALEAKDPYTSGHSARVSIYSVAIARGLGLSSQEIDDVALGGELHDIGKIGVAEELLHKVGSLTPIERCRIMEHTVIGERILRPLLSERAAVLGIVRWHHERVDGAGKPDGLLGSQIPFLARVVAVADAFDAMTSARPYRAARTEADACRELEDTAGTQLDGECVEAFEQALADDAQVRLIAP